MKYRYALEAILKWEYANLSTITEKFTKSKEEYELEYSCSKYGKFNYNDFIDGSTQDGIKICVLAYTCQSKRKRYCSECVEWLELNNSNFALGLEGLSY